MKKMWLFGAVSLAIILVGVSKASASATATISVTPASASHTVGEEFDVAVVADGGGQNMSVVRASVATDNLTIVSLTKGSVSMCQTDPSVTSLSFNCGVTGASGVSSITVYTVKVKGVAAGTATITLSNGRVVSVGSEDIFSSVSNGSYTITAPVVAPVTAPAVSSAKKKTATPSTVVTPVASVETNVAPTLPETESDLEADWQNYAPGDSLALTISVDHPTADTTADTLSGVDFSGTADPNSLVTLYIFSNKITKSTTADSAGKWLITVTDALSGGVHTAYAIATKGTTTTRLADKFVFSVDPTALTAAKVEAADTGLTATISNSTVGQKDAPATKYIAAYILGTILIILIIGFFVKRIIRRKHLPKADAL